MASTKDTIVCESGSESVSAGSAIIMAGGGIFLILFFSSPSSITALFVLSDPVPDVVGTAIQGRAFAGSTVLLPLWNAAISCRPS